MIRSRSIKWRWRSRHGLPHLQPILLLFPILFLAAGWASRGPATKMASWHTASQEQLRSVIPSRALVVNEHIETELRSASGITDGKGHFVAGVVLITAGYSAEGKYSHYLLSDARLKVGCVWLPPGQYVLGWTRGDDSLHITFYDALTGKPMGNVEALRNPSITHVEQIRIWPPADKPMIQLGRFTFNYKIGEN